MSYLSAKTVAAYLDVDPQWVYRRLDTSSGRIKFAGKSNHRKPGSGVRFDSRAVARWIVERRCSTTGAPGAPTQEEIDAEEQRLVEFATLRRMRPSAPAAASPRQRATA